MREHVNLSWGCPRAERPARRFGPTPSREFHRNHNNAMSTSTAKGENGHVTAACAVCGENANGNFFGALVCLPCKSFFIRCNKTTETVSFQVQCANRCTAAKQGRIRCQKCRYLKCLEAGMVRKEKPESVKPGDGEMLCLVCGDIANGTHFGIKTCEGCKKFFRRGLIENKSYVCTRKQACVINPRNRNNCRLCRYRKCVSSGMSREAIKMGRPRKNRKQDTVMKKPPRRRQPIKTANDNEASDKEPTEKVSKSELYSSEFQDEPMDNPLSLRSLLLRSSHFTTKKGTDHGSPAAVLHAPLDESSEDSTETKTTAENTSCFKNMSLMTNENDLTRSQFDHFDLQMTTHGYAESSLLSSTSTSVSTMQSSQLPVTTSVSQISQPLLPVIKIHNPPSPLSPSLSLELESPSDSSSLSTGSSSLSLRSRSLSPGSRPVSPGSRSISPGSLSLGSLSLSSRSSSASNGSRSLSPWPVLQSSLSTSAQSSGSASPSPLPAVLSNGCDPAASESALTTSEIEHMLALLTSNDITEHGYLHELNRTEWNDGASVDSCVSKDYTVRNVDAETSYETRDPVLVRKNSNMNLLFMALNVIQSSNENFNPQESKDCTDHNNNMNVHAANDFAEVSDATREMDDGLSNHLSNQMMLPYKDRRDKDLNKPGAMHLDRSVQVKLENDSHTFPNHQLFSEKGSHFDIRNNHASSLAKPEDKTALSRDEGSTCFNIPNPCTFDNIISVIESFENGNDIAGQDTYIPNGYPSKHLSPGNQDEEKNWKLFLNQRQDQTRHDLDDIKVNLMDLIHDATESHAMDIT